MSINADLLIMLIHFALYEIENIISFAQSQLIAQRCHKQRTNKYLQEMFRMQLKKILRVALWIFSFLFYAYFCRFNQRFLFCFFYCQNKKLSIFIFSIILQSPILIAPSPTKIYTLILSTHIQTIQIILQKYRRKFDHSHYLFIIQFNKPIMQMASHTPGITPTFPSEQDNEFYSINDETSLAQSKQQALLKYDDIFSELLHGYFPKKTSNLTWQERYFVLTPFRLIYYADVSKKQMKGCFNIGSLLEYNIHLNSDYPVITLVVEIEESQEYKSLELIKMLIGNREQFNKWRNTLSSIIYGLSLNTPAQNLINHLSSDHFPKVSPTSLNGPDSNHFWNKMALSIKQFQSYANHLDIIFFRNCNNISNFQRLLMGSYYDHVGVLFRDELNQIYVLEAVQSRGVWIRKWEDILKDIRQNYESVGYRKIEYPKQINSLSSFLLDYEKLETELNRVIGKRYELNFSKLFSSEETPNPTQQQKQQTYFCSQLVADMYIKLGLLKNKNKNELWPKHFQKQLKLENGFQLSHLFEIQF